MKYAAEKCEVCHGDISLNNIVINRVWNNDTDNDFINDNIDDNINNINIKSNDRSGNSNSSTNGNNNNVAPTLDMNENSASNEITDPLNVHTTCNSNNSNNSDLTSLSDTSVESPIDLSSNFMMIMNQPSTPNTKPLEIKAYGLAIDNDNLFSFSNVAKLGYWVKLVRDS